MNGRLEIKKILLIILTPFILIITACGLNSGNSVLDYYREYRFTIPFELRRSQVTHLLSFETEYNFDEMQELIVKAGYNVVRYEWNNSIRLLISRIYNNREIFFVIYDEKIYYEPTPASNWYILDSNLLIPMHIVYMDGTRSVRIIKDFDYLANFYYRFGKDVTINYENQTIDIRAWNVAPKDRVSEIITLQFYENIHGNYFIEFPLGFGPLL